MSAIFTLRKKGLATKQHIALIHANTINNNRENNKYTKKYLQVCFNQTKSLKKKNKQTQTQK